MTTRPFFQTCLLALVGLTLAGCVTEPSDVHVVASSVKKEEPIKAKVVNLKDQFTASAVTNQKLETQVAGLRQTTTELRGGLAEATSAADKLRQQKTATAAELDELWQRFTLLNVQARNLFEEVEAANATAETQRLARLSVEKSMSALLMDAQAKDTEVYQLETQNADLRGALKAAADKQANTDIRLKKAEAQASAGQYAKNMIRGVLIFIAVLVLIFVLFKFILR